ncbi:MAG: thioredoxin family protein [Candidatus Woesearchaeota archaeon]|nr:MAG: thioredoxin family protein [Candidatus Woesearchaeota archaeon]
MESYNIKKNNLRIAGLWIILLAILIALIPLIISISPLQPIKDSSACPSSIQGNENADLVIKYFYSTECIQCLGEEKILNNLVKSHGDLFKLEKYNIAYCILEASSYDIQKTPSFVFINKKENEYYVDSRYLPEDLLERAVCKSTGACF